MKHTINETYTKYHVEKLPFVPLTDSRTLKDGFVVRIGLKALPKKGERRVLSEIGGALKIVCGTLCFPNDYSLLDGYKRAEGYDVYTDNDGVSPYIEAEIKLYQQYGNESVRSMTLGLPLKLFDASKMDIFLLYDGVRFAWIVDGEAVNVNFPFGCLQPTDELFVTDEVHGICNDLSSLESVTETETKERSISFYSARGYNAWAGDVVNFWHDGVYYLLVLYDRHHHGNRFGGGAHSTYLMTTRDFVHWENHGEIYPLRHQWETFGTGTMFYFKGKYYYCHGFHTDRFVPRESVGSRLLEKNYETDGAFNAVSYEELQRHGLFPSGANYLTSDDGIHFVPALKQIHCSENPSIYVDNNELIMYAGYGASGVWRAPDIDGPWEKEKSSLPLFANSSPVRNSTECPSIFERDGYKYILAGFTGYWQSGYRNNDFVDLAARGEDIYDGLCVPMVANCNGRYILAGWVAGLGWASVILHRELVWHEDGKVGIKWLSELTPSADDLSKVSFVDNVCANEFFALDGRTSYYLQCTVKPQKDGKVGLAVCGNGKPFVFELNSERKKVQIKETSNPNDFTEEAKALCEYIPEMPEERLGFAQLPEDIHMHSRDFAIVNVRELEAEYTLKVIFHYEEKTDSLFVDAEIGGGRTFVSNRTYFRAESVKFLLHNAEVTNLQLGKLQQ